ncbi:Papain family cysteine protease [Phytophthora infestans]|uniref:Papain family cysteine protease n=1 Tax=Phytophthora infestans TaxID=4787 RepID=A0A833SIP1_PHYIN|nr:Papain family cysteine protease [Phytophthora infestans]
MNTALLLALAALVATADAAAPAVPTDRMEQFLEEKAVLHEVLNEWKQSDAGLYAMEHGFVPTASARNVSATTDEELRRFFLSKLLVEDAQAANPEAVFSTDTPFTLLTHDEFAKFIGESYQRDSGPLKATSIADALPLNLTAASTEKDWTTSGCVAPVKNQGDCGSCWAFASVAALESAICLSGQPLTLLSEQQVVDCDKVSYACDGGWPSTALDYAKQSGGICTQEAYPYVSGDLGYHQTCKSTCTRQKVTIRKVVAVPRSDAGLVQAIETQPVAVGVAADNPTWKQYKSGVVSSCSTSQLDHAVLAVGYSPSFFKIKSSWCPQWGENGFMRLKRGSGTSSSGTCGIIGSLSVYP